jgi:2-octaprenylphenol hydroxylase
LSSSRPDFDIVVVGGGMVGPCFAALAARDPHVGGLRVALVEPATPAAPRAGEVDLRVSALSRASQRILNAVEAWEPIEREACSYSAMVVWDAASRPDAPDALKFSAAETGEPDLGHIVENLRVQWALSESPLLRRLTRLHTALCGSRARARTARGSRSPTVDGCARRWWWAPTAAHRRHASSPASSASASRIPRRPLSRISRPRGHTRRRPGSVSFPADRSRFFPLRDGRVSIVWTTTPAEAELLVDLPAEEFSARVTEATGRVLGDMTLASGRARFPLALWHAREYCSPGSRS